MVGSAATDDLAFPNAPHVDEIDILMLKNIQTYKKHLLAESIDIQFIGICLLAVGGMAYNKNHLYAYSHHSVMDLY